MIVKTPCELDRGAVVSYVLALQEASVLAAADRPAQAPGLHC